MSFTKKIEVVNQNCLLASYHWTNVHEDNAEAVMLGQFNLPQEGIIDAYAKFYHPESRGLINEITAWLLAQDVGLPVPKKAFLGYLPISSLPKPLIGVPFIADQHSVTHLLAFCTTDEAPLGIQPLAPLKDFCSELKGWSKFSECLVFDECTANADRHVGNFVRRGHQDFIAIDHGRLAWELHAPNWCQDTLSPVKLYENRLFDIMWKMDKSSINAPKAITSSHQLRQKITSQTLHEIQYWCDNLILTPADSNAWIGFISARQQGIETLMQQRIGLLPI